MALRTILFALVGLAVAMYDTTDMGGMPMSSSASMLPPTSTLPPTESLPLTTKMLDEPSTPATSMVEETTTMNTTTTVVTSVYTSGPSPMDMDNMPGMPMGTGKPSNATTTSKLPVSAGVAVNQAPVSFPLSTVAPGERRVR